MNRTIVSRAKHSTALNHRQLSWNGPCISSVRPRNTIPDIFTVRVLRTRTPNHIPFAKSSAGSKLVGIVPADQYWSSACPATVLERSWSSENAPEHEQDFGFCHGIQINLPSGGYAPLTRTKTKSCDILIKFHYLCLKFYFWILRAIS